MSRKRIKSALISVYHKDNLDKIVNLLAENEVQLYSTGGTLAFIESLGHSATPVEDVTNYPSIFGGRVKTLHPKIFGGILYRRNNESDQKEAREFEIPDIDLVIVDLYPFEDTVGSGASHDDIIEKIDIGGISLIRGAAKNYNDVLIVSSMNQYKEVFEILGENECNTTEEERKRFASYAFDVSSHYDSSIFNYFNEEQKLPRLKVSENQGKSLRYGENPHQKGTFFGSLEQQFDQLNGKELSYNNLVDIDAAVSLVQEFDETCFAILKHTNACGIALGTDAKEAYLKAFAADTVSAFGGVLATNANIDQSAAEELHKLFFEVLIAPSFDDAAVEILKVKKNRILLVQKEEINDRPQIKTLLNGYIVQDKDLKTDTFDELTNVTKVEGDDETRDELLFASKIAKHTKSNTIVLSKNKQLLASGVGQTSRVDSLEQAVAKAKHFGFDLDNAVMASDAFFPFPDCVEIAHKAGISSVIQPGGSIKDQASIDYCNENGMCMVFTGTRHFKH